MASIHHTNLYDIDPGPQCPRIVRMIVEIPKNSRYKYEYSKDCGIFRLDRPLFSPMHYPGDYGFVPGTLAEDGDPLDVVVVVDEPSFTGCMVDIRPVGLLRMMDRSEPDEKIIAVQEKNPRYEEIRSVRQIFPHLRREIEYFFNIYKELERKHTRILGWEGITAAHRSILASRRRYLRTKRGR